MSVSNLAFINLLLLIVGSYSQLNSDSEETNISPYNGLVYLYRLRYYAQLLINDIAFAWIIHKHIFF